MFPARRKTRPIRPMLPEETAASADQACAGAAVRKPEILPVHGRN